MIEFPSEVYDIVKRAVEKSPDDIAEASAIAEREIRRLPNYPDLVDPFVSFSVRRLAYTRRHEICRGMRDGFFDEPQDAHHSNGEGRPAKVRRLTESVRNAYDSLYMYPIGGKTLGKLTGAELPAVEAKERSASHGHAINADLLKALIGKVPDDKEVQEAIPLKKLNAIARGLGFKLDCMPSAARVTDN